MKVPLALPNTARLPDPGRKVWLRCAGAMRLTLDLTSQWLICV